MSRPSTQGWDHENGMMYDEEDDNLDGIESLMNEQSDDDDDDDDTNSRSDNDAEESSGEEDERDEAELLEDEENYRRFVHSVFFDDDARSANSFNDEDDEEYKPDEALDGDDEEDEDDERTNRRLDKIRTTELKGLVNECWQTIAGEAPVLPAPSSDKEYILDQIGDSAIDGLVSPSKRKLQSPNSKQRLKVARSIETENTSRNENDQLGSSSSRMEQRGSATATVAVATSLDDLDSPSKSVRTNTSAAKKGATGSSGQSLISSLVSQMFTGEKPFDVCIEGMPVEAIRKLVARQMSMATQLLMQILLLADEKSECFTTAYTSLMELSNLRDTSLKKAKLIQMNMSNVAAIHSYNRDLQRQKKLRKEGLHDDSSVASSTTGYENEAVDNILALKSLRGAGGVASAHELSDSESVTESRPKTPQVERRLTRSGMSALTNTRSTSVFDIPALTKVNDLFKLIDQARQEMKQQKATTSSSSGAGVEASKSAATSALTTTSTATTNSSEDEREKQKRTDVSSSSSSSDSVVSGPEEAAQRRTERLSLARPLISRILVKTGMRVWTCLLPLRGYPLHESVVLRTDPTSLTGRSMFTPAEDDLLLRGIITLGENNWAKIKTTFLPSKEAQLLQFRFSQMTSLTASQDNNIFKRYQKLEMEHRTRDVKWSHEEDIDLLRGFQIFGERWPLIAIFFLPNRKRREIKQRWLQLQKIWQRGFQIHQVVRDGSPTEMTDSMRTFLKEINHSHTQDSKSASLAPSHNSVATSASSAASAGGVDAKKRAYQNAAVGKLKATNGSSSNNSSITSVDMFLNQPAFGQYQYHHHYPPPLRAGTMPQLMQQLLYRPVVPAALDPQSFPGSPPQMVQLSQQQQQQRHEVVSSQSVTAAAAVSAEADSYLGRFADSNTLMDFDLSSNFAAPPSRVVDMTSAPVSVAAPVASVAIPQSGAPFAGMQTRGATSSSLTSTASVAPLSLGPFLLDNNRVPPSAPYVPVDYNTRRQQIAAATAASAVASMRPTLFSSATGSSGHSSSSSSSASSMGIAGMAQSSYVVTGDRNLSSPEGQSRDSVTKINILQAKPKKAKTAAAPASAPAPSAVMTSTDTLDGLTLSSLPGFQDDSIQIIPSSLPADEMTSSSFSRKPPKSKSASTTKTNQTKIAEKTAAKSKTKRGKTSSTVDLSSEDTTSLLLQQGNSDTISGLLQLPFDASATDSAWGLAALSRLPYDAAVSSVFNNDQSTMEAAANAASGGLGGGGGSGEVIHDDGLFSNLMQLGGLSNLLPLQSPSRPTKPGSSSSSAGAAAINTPGKPPRPEDSVLFSPPTGRLGQATNIKRKLSTSRNLLSSLSESQGGIASGGVPSAATGGSSSSNSNAAEMLSPSKKIKKGGLFASVMANVKK